MASALCEKAAQGRVAFASRPRQAVSRCSVRVSCQAQQGPAHKVQLAAAAFAAAALLHSAPADAGVIMDSKPQLKKLFQDDSPAVVIEKKAVTGLRPAPRTTGTASAPAPRVEEVVETGGLDPKVVALPGSLVLIAAGAAALLAVDDGFAQFFNDTVVKDSNDYAGYEPVLKTGNGISVKTGTKKVKAKFGSKAGKK